MSFLAMQIFAATQCRTASGTNIIDINVPRRVDVRIHIAVTAKRAGVSSVFTLGAGRLGNFGGAIGAVAAINAVFPDAEIEIVGTEAQGVPSDKIDIEIFSAHPIGGCTFQRRCPRYTLIMVIHWNVIPPNLARIGFEYRQVDQLFPPRQQLVFQSECKGLLGVA